MKFINNIIRNKSLVSSLVLCITAFLLFACGSGGSGDSGSNGGGSTGSIAFTLDIQDNLVANSGKLAASNPTSDHAPIASVRLSSVQVHDMPFALRISKTLKSVLSFELLRYAWTLTPSMAYADSVPKIGGLTDEESIHLLAQATQDEIDCDFHQIDIIEAFVYDEEGLEIAKGGPWSCNQHEGTIKNVPAGKQRKLKAIARGKDDSILLTGESEPITVVAGQTNNVGFIELTNHTPQVTIDAPADGSGFNVKDPVQFTGRAEDDEDGDLNASLEWSSSLDGPIGTGGSFETTSLSIGFHTITASATDSRQLTGSASISIIVGSVIFDFEELIPTYQDINGGDPRPGALTSLSSTKLGITIDISREGLIEFDTVDNNSGIQVNKPASFGDVSLDPFAFDNFDSAFIVNFSIPVSSLSVVMGDYNTIIDVTPDQDDDVLTLKAYLEPDAAGKLLDSDQIEMPDVPSPKPSLSFEMLSVATTDACIRSISMIGGSVIAPNSVFYDNIVVEALCESP
jgi:hypothetical protein